MTALPDPAKRVATLRTRDRNIASQMLGVGIFVSLYVHIAGPTLYGLATTADVGLLAPTRNRASLELTMSLPSRASQASAEAALVRLESPRDAVREAEKLADGSESLTIDQLTAAPTGLDRSEPSSTYVSAAARTDIATSEPSVDPGSGELPSPRLLDRRAEVAAPRSAELVAEAYSAPRAATVDSPAQMASAIRLGAETENLPEVAFNQPPVYPAEALRQGVEGTTIVAAKISRTGSVLDSSIARSSGSALLDQAAEAAVRRWTFRPALRFGLAVEMEVGVPVVFSIREALESQRDAAASAGRKASPTGPAR